MSQEELPQAVKTTPDTISPWETARYKPSISDLERLAQILWCSQRELLCHAQPGPANALLTAAAELDEDDSMK